METVYLNAVDYYLPEGKLTNEHLSSEFPEWSVEKISSKTGIHERHVAADDELSSDLAVAAAEKLFAHHPEQREQIDFVLFCTQSPDYFLPTTACILQDRLRISTSCGALDFNLGCSGYVYGLGLAKGLVATGQAKKVLFLTGETYSKFVGRADKSSRTIFGDGASASIISTEPTGFSIGHFNYATDGAGFDKLIVKHGGMRNRHNQSVDKIDEFGNVNNEGDLYMDGPAIFTFTLNDVPKLVSNTLDKNQVAKEDISLFIFHQANRFMLEFIRKKIKIPKEDFVVDMSDCGNTVSATIPIALKRRIEENHFTPGQNIALVGFGVGLSLGGCVITTV